MPRLKKGELPTLTGIYSLCKICLKVKDDALFKWQNGKRAGLVCRECDLNKKRELYKTDEVEKERAKANAKQWRMYNSDRAKQIAKNYRAINEKDLKHKKKLYHIEHAEHINNKTRKWYRNNKEKHKAVGKIYRETNKEMLARLRSEYYQENKLEYKERAQEWRKNNPHVMTAYVRQYNLAKINRTPKWADIKAIKKFYRNCPKGCEVDHIHPLQGKLISGLHVLENLQYLTSPENRSKNRKFKSYWVFYEPTGIRVEIIST